MNIGKLYQIKQYFWMLYPSRDIAVDIQRPTHGSDPDAEGVRSVTQAAAYWSQHFDCNTSYLSPETIFFPVEVNGNYVKVISTEGIGWMVYPDNESWTKGCIEEVKEE